MKGSEEPILILYSLIIEKKKVLTSTTHKGNRTLILSHELPEGSDVLIQSGDFGERIVVQRKAGRFDDMEVYPLHPDGTILALDAVEIESVRKQLHRECFEENDQGGEDRLSI